MRTDDIQSGLSDNNYNAKRRIRLMQKDPHCYWCRRELKLYPDYWKWRHRQMPKDYPTIDHLNSRLLGNRYDPGMKGITLVLSCPDCNNKRSKEEQQTHIWRTRWISGSFPFPLRWFGRMLKWWRKKTRRKMCTFDSS